MSLVANFISLFGCISPGAKDFALYRINVTLLAEGLVQHTHNASLNAADLGDPSLPTWWYWGMTGVCDVDEVTKETRCHRAFPPTKSILSIVEDSLRDGLPNSQDPLPANSSAVLSAWNTTLNELPAHIFADKEARFVTLIKASAALVILAIIIDFACPPLAFLESWRFAAPTISCLIAIAAGTLATLAMYKGPHGAIKTGENGGVGIIILFVGAALRLGSLALAGAVLLFDSWGCFDSEPYVDRNEQWRIQHQQWSTQQPQRPIQLPLVPIQPEELSNKEIGYRGESHVTVPTCHVYHLEILTSSVRCTNGFSGKSPTGPPRNGPVGSAPSTTNIHRFCQTRGTTPILPTAITPGPWLVFSRGPGCRYRLPGPRQPRFIWR